MMNGRGVDAPLRVAVPKGSLFSDAVAALGAAGLDVSALADHGRHLMVSAAGVEYLMMRPTDIPVFVAYGGADCALVGKDTLVETELEVVELVDLGFGGCRFVVAEPEDAGETVEETYRRLGVVRVATKYPRITAAYYESIGVQAEVIKLHGNIELAPLIGMADRIVDITATGRTLAENRLRVVDDVLESTARFIANPAALRTDERVLALADRLAESVSDA